MSKFVSIIAIIFISLMATVPVVFATSGACSDHRGVDCTAGPSVTGNVVCNDGWTDSSVSYNDVDECQTKPACTQAQLNGLQQKYDTSADLTQIASLDNEIASLNTTISSSVGWINEAERNAMARIDALDAQISPLENDLEQKESLIISECTALGYDDMNQQIYTQQAREEQQLQQLTQATSSTSHSQVGGFFTINSNLSIGATGADVITLQKFLEDKGLLTLPTGIIEGYFGSLTKQALISFQQSAGLPATGYCGPMTRSTIDASTDNQ